MKDDKEFKRISSLWLRFSIIVLSIMLIVTFLTSAITILLFSNNMFPPKHYYTFTPFSLVLTILTSVLLSATIAVFVGRRIIKPIDKLSRALKRVSSGNFSVKLENDNIIQPISEMYENFNAMVKDLSETETLKTDFVANVSHEFKTPLAAIEGYATLLQNKNLTDEKRNEYIDRVIGNAQRLSDLTGNVLSLSKLENQSTVTNKKTFLLDEQLRKTVLLLETQWEKKNIEFDIDLQATPFFGNESLLHQVWFNLISNAIKFSHQNGIIKITIQDDEKFVNVSVADNGIGIPLENQKHIFEKFYQADITRSSEGNGLGLSLAQKIVSLCGGSIDLKSKEGVGSEFIVKLTKENGNSKQENN